MSFIRAFLLAIAVFITAMASPQPSMAQGIPGLGSLTSSDSTSSDTSSSLAALLELLKDPAVVDELIAKLETVDGDTSAQAEQEAPSQAPSLGRQVAEITSQLATSTIATLGNILDSIKAAPQSFDDLGAAFDPNVLWIAAQSLLFVVFVTYAVFLSLRFLARKISRRLGVLSEDFGFLGTLMLNLLSSSLDIVTVALAWAAGYALTIIFFGESGTIDLNQSLYLNAFLLVELVKIAIRSILAPKVPNLRLISLPNRGAKALSRWFAVSVAILGYGLLLAVPMVNRYATFAAGEALARVLSVIVVVLAFGTVMRFRQDVTAYLLTRPDGTQRIERRAGRKLVSLWYVPILLYLVVMFVIVSTRPGGILIPLLTGSGVVLTALLSGMITTHLLSNMIAHGISLPEKTTQRFPLLEGRLNGFVPKLLMVLRGIIMLAVIGITIDITGIYDVSGWIASDTGSTVVTSVITAVVVLTIGFAIWLVLSSYVEYRLNPDFGTVPTARETTLLTLLRNAATIALVIIVAMIALSELGVNIAPLLASAGVLGLAIGFGAQKLVQDIITGVFIQFENAINVGDVVTVGGITGAVDKLTVRSVSLRDLHGVYHIVPFSSVDMVSNYMRDFSYYVVDMGIAYREDTEFAKQAMHDAFDELKSGDMGRNILGNLEWMGLDAFGDSAVVLRCRVKTVPGQQWATGREFNRILKVVFDARGIEIPFPHQTIYWGEDRDGKAPPLRVATEGKVQLDTAPQNTSSKAKETTQPETPLEVKTDPEQQMPDSNDEGGGEGR